MLIKVVILAVILSCLLRNISEAYFSPKAHPSVRRNRCIYSAFTGSVSAGSGGSDDERKGVFDSDFADSMSKPLPEWYKQQAKDQENVLKEIEENRDRILREFRAKYDVSEVTKLQELKNKMKIVDERDKKNKLMKSAMNFLSGKSKVKEPSEKLSEETKLNWEKFWDDEQKTTGFYLPGIFEVFPELLRIKWPTWARRKDGSAIACETDSDCPFPQACCPHPIIPGDKFCCTGLGTRIMVPAYQVREVTSNLLEDSDNDRRGGRGSECRSLGVSHYAYI